MNKLSTDDAGELKDKIYQVIQEAPRRMKDFEIEEAVTMAYKQALGITAEVEIRKLDNTTPKPLTIWAIGKDPEEAIMNFFGNEEWFEPVKLKIKVGEPLPKGNEKEYPWGFYVIRDGDHYKAAGTYISGYSVLTWWK